MRLNVKDDQRSIIWQEPPAKLDNPAFPIEVSTILQAPLAQINNPVLSFENQGYIIVQAPLAKFPI